MSSGDTSEQARDAALEVIAAEFLLQIVRDAGSDPEEFDSIRESTFEGLGEDDFYDALEKLSGLVPPALFPKPGEVAAAVAFFTRYDEDDDDW